MERPSESVCRFQTALYVTAPLLKPFRRVLPMVGQFDLTPLVALLVIQVVLVLVDPTVVLALLGGH